MKYIKAYKRNYFWEVDKSTPEIFEIGLIKLGMDEKTRKTYLNNISIKSDGKSSVYIGHNPTRKFHGEADPWGYMELDWNSPIFYREHNYKFMGKLEITEEDKLNYEIQKNAEKYNL